MTECSLDVLIVDEVVTLARTQSKQLLPKLHLCCVFHPSTRLFDDLPSRV